MVEAKTEFFELQDEESPELKEKRRIEVELKLKIKEE